MYLNEQAVSQQFREAIAALMPGMAKNKGYWHLLGHLLFSGSTDKHEWTVCTPFLALMEEKKVTGKYSGWRFLEAFQKDTGIVLDIKAHTLSHCRTITKVHWPEKVYKLAKAERRTVGGDRVLFSSGINWRPEHAARDRKQVQAEAIELMQNLGHHPAYNLLNLLNFAAPNRFAIVKRHLEEAHSLVDTLSLIDDEIERQHNILKAIEKQAQPFYSPAERSVRIFAMNESLTRLQRDVRKVMTQDFVTADLRSAQMAIVAKVWELADVEAFLRTKESAWRVFCAWMGLAFNESSKQTIKDALYALIFGAGRDKMIGLFEETIGSGRSAYQRFRSHPLIRSLFLGRASQLKIIRNQKYGTDAYGKRIDMEYIAIPGKMYSYDTSRKILALIAQSWELRLMEPIINLALEHKDDERGFCLLTWLHDGCTFAAYRKSETASWSKTLALAVKQQAEALGIETELEIG